jgi:hypothetical protein
VVDEKPTEVRAHRPIAMSTTINDELLSQARKELTLLFKQETKMPAIRDLNNKEVLVSYYSTVLEFWDSHDPLKIYAASAPSSEAESKMPISEFVNLTELDHYKSKVCRDAVTELLHNSTKEGIYTAVTDLYCKRTGKAWALAQFQAVDTASTSEKKSKESKACAPYLPVDRETIGKTVRYLPMPEMHDGMTKTQRKNAKTRMKKATLKAEEEARAAEEAEKKAKAEAEDNAKAARMMMIGRSPKKPHPQSLLNGKVTEADADQSSPRTKTQRKNDKRRIKTSNTSSAGASAGQFDPSMTYQTPGMEAMIKKELLALLARGEQTAGDSSTSGVKSDTTHGSDEIKISPLTELLFSTTAEAADTK